MHIRHKNDLLHCLVDDLYEAAANPEKWINALDLCDQLFGANSAHVFYWDNSVGTRIAGYRSRSFADDHPEWDYYHRLNPRREILSRLRAGTPLNCADYIDDRAVQKSEFFNDYSLPAGRRFLLGVYPFNNKHTTTAFAVMRGPNDSAFSSSDARLMERLAPHLRRVARIEQRLRAALTDSQYSVAALNKLADAIIVVDEKGCIVRSNEVAESMFFAGQPLRSVSGRLYATDEFETDKLRELISQVSRMRRDEAEECGGAFVIDSPSGDRCGVTVVPMRPSASLFDLADKSFALVVASKVNRPDSLTNRIRQAFCLTPAEARLADQVMQGKRLEDIASENQVRTTTLRTQLKSIFLKTGTSRQSDLVGLGNAFAKLGVGLRRD